MTTVQYILIIIAVVIMMIGLYMIVRGFLNRNKDSAGEFDVQYKDGVPIIPRHERHLEKENDEQLEENPEEEPINGVEFDDDIIITPDRDELQTISNEASDIDETHQPNWETKYSNQENLVQGNAEDIGSIDDRQSFQEVNDQQETFQQDTFQQEISQHQKTETLENQNQPAQSNEQNEQTTEQQTSFASQSVSNNELATHSQQLHDDNEDDLFSSLASATESLMPVIQTAQEPNFADNSPVLDGHLLAEVDHDQNNPLNNAQENINITLVPKNNMEMIYGKTVLELVNQYGLKYGAMNMFHRYENKDGTGILWFSMMGITEEGDITPFDLNVLPNSRFKGLVLFLSLPHPKAMQGFDSMMSVVNLISNDLNTLVLDENNEELTRERRQQLRAQVQEYQASHNL